MGPWRWPLLWCLHAVLVLGTILVGGQRPQERPPQPAGWSLAPSSSWVPTPEPGASGDTEGSAAALAFLQTGDAQRLARANCSRGITAGAPGPGPPPALRAALRAAPEALAHAANFLNMLFQTNDIREASVAEDVEWYQALVRSLAEGHPWVRRAVLALDAHPLAAKPRLMLQATKGDGEILLQDVSAAAPSLGNLSWDNEWFNALKSQRTPLLRKRVLSNDLRSMETPKWQRGDSYVGEPGHVRWSPPFLECRDGRFLPAWAVTLSSAFYGLKPDLSPEFKGVVRVDIELRDVAIDQCASGPGWFADTHRCDLNSTQCVPQESRGFVLGRYLCRCKPGFYGVSGAASGARAGAAGSVAGADGGSRLACRPCRHGCATCEDDAPCLIQEDWALRAAVLSCQACCMLAVFLSMLVSYHFRRSKRIRASGIILLETILFGSLLLYFPVFILYFKPSIFRCIVLRWVRMLGFAIVYGTITLKLYRVLKVFLSRTAQRVPYVSSERVLKMLGLILLLVLWFLAAWTVGMLENVDKKIPLVIRTQTARGLHFYICGHDRWDYMMVIAEMLFLLWGSFLCYATRAVPSAFHEPRYMGIALHNELMISAAFHVVRFTMVPSLHPDWTLLLFFAHTHGTITMTLALLFIPKFLHAGSPLREEIAAEVYEDELDMRRSGSCLNSSIASAWSEHSLDPDDIREELKKLYTQLEVHKARRMAANNPHLPKKRSSRRSLGRSIARRLAKLPEAVGRQSGLGERLGTPAHRRSSSAKRLPNAGSTSLRMRDEGSWRRIAALRKSRSTEGPVRGSPTPGPPGEPALGKKTMAATASEQSDSESLDDAPLLHKSASAQDLGGHGQPPPPRAAPLQKSHSVVAGAWDEALLAASRAAREEWDANRHPSTPALGYPTGQGPPMEAGKPQSPGAADAPTAAGSGHTKGCPQEDASPLGDGKAQRHVTYAPVKSISVDSSHLPGRVRVAVKRTPPPPPIRYQSLVQRATLAGDGPEPAQPPAEPPGTAEGTGVEDVGHTAPPARKGRLLTAASIPAQVCPWELVQEEILSQKQKATEAEDSGTPGDVAATPSSQKPPSQKTSFQGLGLAIKAFNRSRGKSSLKGKREGEGSLRKGGREREGGSRRERPSLAGTSAVSLGGIGQAPAAKSPEWSRQRPGSEPSACPWQGETVPCQHNNNAGSTWEAAGWGDGGAEGQRDSPAPGNGEKLAEEPSAPWGDADAGSVPGVHEVLCSAGHQDGAKHPHETPAAAGSGKAQLHPREAAEAPGKDAPAGLARLITPREGVAGLAEGIEAGSRSIHPRDHVEVEQPRAKPAAGSTHPSSTGVQNVAAEKGGAEGSPRGAVGVPGGRGALLRQEAIASQDDSGVLPGRQSPATVLEKGSSQPEPLGPGGTKRVPARSQSAEVALAAAGKAGGGTGRQVEVCPGETRADSNVKIEICPWEESERERWGLGRALGKGSSEGESQRPGGEQGMEKPPAKTPELPKAALEKAGSVEGRRAEVCPWETGEGGRTVRAEICPWDAEGAQPEQERQEGERRRLGKWVKSIRPNSLGLPRAREGGSSLRAAGRPCGSASSEGPPPKPAPRSSELPEATSRSPASARASVCPWEAAGADSDAEVCPWERGTALSNTEKISDGEISQGENMISPWRAALRGTGETAPAADKGSSRWESPCSGEGAEQPGTGLAAKHTALPKTSSRQAGTIDSKKANICPWEVEDEPPESEGLEDLKAKLAEMSDRQPERGETRIFAKLIRKRLESSKAQSKKFQSVESIKEEICPWESLGMEQPPAKTRAGSPALPKSPSKTPQSMGSLKAEVCPWEAPEVEATHKAEICPWEVAAPPSSKEKPSQDKGLSVASRSPSTRQGLLKETAESTLGKEKASRERESICPWESTDTESPSTARDTRSTELRKGTAKKSESTGSAKVEICPWESLGMEQPLANTRAGSPALPKSPSKTPQSAGSLKAEVCPWEAPEVEATHKAEICPWEVAAPPSSKEKPSQDKGLSVVSRSPSTRQGLLKETAESTLGEKEKASSEQEAVCPWESLGTEQPPAKPRAGSPALPKSPSKTPQSAGSLKAEVCPWELKATDNAEICPWEAAAPAPHQPEAKQGPGGASKGDKRITRQAALASPVRSLQRGSSEREAVCPWESLGTEQPLAKTRAGSPALPKSPSKTPQSAGSLKAEVCPWEAPEVEATHKAEICPGEVAVPPSSKEKPSQDKGLSVASRSPSTGQGLLKETAESTLGEKEKASSEQEAVCPWETLGTESPSTAHDTRSTELRKGTAKKSESTGSAKVEICPWESLGMEQPPAKPRAGSPALPKSPSKTPQSAGSLKAEVCPWELKATDNAEICPWEAAAPLPEEGAAPGKVRPPPKRAGASTALERRSSEREAICPWESQGSGEPFPKMEKELSEKSDSRESWISDICPWEAADPTALEKESFGAGAHPQGADRASPTGMGKSKPVTGASTVSSTSLPKKSKGRSNGEAEHKPLCRILPGTQPLRGRGAEPLPGGASLGPAAGSSPGPGTSVAEVCPWEAAEAPAAPDKSSRDTRKTSEACPWEVESAEPSPTLRRQGRAGASPGDGDRGVSETKPEVCPWDHE